MNKMNSKDIKNINLPKILNKTEELWWKEIFKSQMI
jgi:hypothetical protein